MVVGRLGVSEIQRLLNQHSQTFELFDAVSMDGIDIIVMISWPMSSYHICS